MMMERGESLFRVLRDKAGRLAGAALCCPALFLVACTTLFDSPPEAVANDASAKVMSDLASMEQNVSAAIPGKLKEAGVTVAEAARDPAAAAGGAMNAAVSGIEHSAMGAARDGAARALTPAHAPPREMGANDDGTIALSFERIDADMPQVAVRGLDNAAVLVDGERIGLGGVTRAGRIGLIVSGRHHLRVECPHEPPFSADLKVEKGDRVVLRGQCKTPLKAVPANVRAAAVAGKDPAPATPAPRSSTEARKIPALTFEKSGDGAPPRLVLRGTGELVVFIDDERVGPDRGDGVPIRAGNHKLRAFPAGASSTGASFSADFPAENGDRIILCGDCAPGGDVRALVSGGGAPVVEKGRDAAPPASPAAARDTAPLPLNGGKTPTLTFDRINVEAAQLVIRNMGDATVIIDGERFAPDGIMGVDRLIPIQPGRHSLEAISPRGAPFAADFDIEAGERATLRGE
ncbi:MAG: hypothetical protein LBE06_05895 [Azoarcus sp.]|jgi:hypothetical protein|nr:hypothetical protein [Azoarcus sp.]